MVKVQQTTEKCQRINVASITAKMSILIQNEQYIIKKTKTSLPSQSQCSVD